MLSNAYFLAKIGADTAENEQHFAEILPIGRRVADRCDDLRRREGAVAGRFERHQERTREEVPGRRAPETQQLAFFHP